MRSRDFTTFIILFGLLIGLAIVSAMQRPAQDPRARRDIPQTTYSADEDGALALHSWLNAVGYRAQRIENIATFAMDDDVRLAFILNPIESIAKDDAEKILRWVERGNTLVLADDWVFFSMPLMNALRVDIRNMDDFIALANVVQPVQGLATEQVRVQASQIIQTAREDAVVVLRANNQPVLITFTHGKGKVWVSSTPYLFSNASLQDDANAAFVLSLVNHVPRNSVIAFDEFHHGYRSALDQRELSTLNALLFQTPWGWALIFAFVVIFAYLIISGQRFGRVMPLTQAIERRSPAEYVSAVAHLLRRAGKRVFILEHYRRQIKRILGKPYHLNPDLSDDEFVTELARYRELDRTALLNTLRELAPRPARVNEKSLVQLAAQAIEATERKKE